MNWLPVIVLSLYLTAVALPAIGLVKLSRRTTAEAAYLAEAQPAKDGGVSIGQFNALAKIIRDRVETGPGSVRTDLILIGGGILAGSVGGALGLIPVFTFV